MNQPRPIGYRSARTRGVAQIVTVKMYPEELDILDAISELSGDDRSTCIRRAILRDQMVDRARITRHRAKKLTPEKAEIKVEVVVQAWLARQLELLRQSNDQETNPAKRLVGALGLNRLDGLIEALALLAYGEGSDDGPESAAEENGDEKGDGDAP